VVAALAALATLTTVTAAPMLPSRPGRCRRSNIAFAQLRRRSGRRGMTEVAWVRAPLRSERTRTTRYGNLYAIT
jgi:hypothetical protein